MKVPDTSRIQEAISICKPILSENLYNHSMRTYYLGCEYGKNQSIPFSEEDLFLVSLFHDIGFFSPYKIKGKSFQIGSSIALRDYLLKDKAKKPKEINALMEAIDFHFQFFPKWELGEIAGLLQVGAHMDVLGTKSHTIDSHIREEVLREYPKENFFWEFNICLVQTFTGVCEVGGVLFPEHFCGRDHYL